MPNAGSTPWERLVQLPDSSHWWVAGDIENVPGSLLGAIEDGEDIEALVVLQDCNVAGQYYRYFWYTKNSEQRRCDVDAAWLFSNTAEKGVDRIVDGQELRAGAYSFVVTPCAGTGPFMKVLLRKYGDE